MPQGTSVRRGRRRVHLLARAVWESGVERAADEGTTTGNNILPPRGRRGQGATHMHRKLDTLQAPRDTHGPPRRARVEGSEVEHTLCVCHVHLTLAPQRGQAARARAQKGGEGTAAPRRLMLAQHVIQPAYCCSKRIRRDLWWGGGTRHTRTWHHGEGGRAASCHPAVLSQRSTQQHRRACYVLWQRRCAPTSVTHNAVKFIR